MKLIPHSKPTIDNKDVEIVAKIVKSTMIAQGKEVQRFESDLFQYLGARHAVVVNTGSAALHLALLAIGVQKGDKVVVPTYVCTALINALSYVGATPILVDVNEDGNINSELVSKVITSKVKAILVPHMFGRSAEITSLKQYKIPIIEDCAQSIGADYKNKKVGSLGDMGVCSFYATKMMTTGEGGAVIFNKKKYQSFLVDHRDYDHRQMWEERFNYKMTEMQAALGITQLSKLDFFIKRRKYIASLYTEALKDIPVNLPETDLIRPHTYFRYVIKLKKNKLKFISYMKSKKIVCASPLFKPLHKYLNQESFPSAEKLARESVSIPIYPELSDSNIHRIIKAVQDFF